MMRTRFHEAALLAAMLVLAVIAAKAGPALPEGVAATALGDRLERYDFHSAALNNPLAFPIVSPHGYQNRNRLFSMA